MTEFLPELRIVAPDRQRRLTVLVRWLLLIPQFVVVYFLGIAAGVVAIIGWFAALVLGRLPDWAAGFLGDFVAYITRVYAYSYLLVDTYPPFRFQAPEYPVTIGLAPGRLNRLAVLFRIILVIPAAIVTDVVTAGWAVLAFFIWLTVLILGRTPQPVFGATAATLRYAYRTQAYFLLLSSAYPKRLFGDDGDTPPRPAEPDPTATHSSGPLLLSSGARALLVIYIVLGVLAIAGSETGQATWRHTDRTPSYGSLGRPIGAPVEH